MKLQEAAKNQLRTAVAVCIIVAAFAAGVLTGWHGNNNHRRAVEFSRTHPTGFAYFS